MSRLRVVKHPRIQTLGPDGRPNGSLIPVWNVHEKLLPEDRAPEQVYLTICAPGARKGPHLHLKRWGYFTCIKGDVRIVVRLPQGYEVAWSGESHDYATIEVPAGAPALIENLGPTDAYVLNTPAPAWRPDDTDEHAVEGWDYAG
jgi:mannose-6-phosphate isomerase-like protein (cupin superfamily)